MSYWFAPTWFLDFNYTYAFSKRYTNQLFIAVRQYDRRLC
jgi:hypothetical protein